MKHKLALITGATGGIGEALVSLLAEKNIFQILVGRDYEKLLSLTKKYPNSQPLVVDLTKTRKSLIEAIWEMKPDLIINNAGFGYYGEVFSLSTQDQLDILEVNAKALLEITVEGIKAMKAASQKGVILNVSSIAGEIIAPLMSVYAASKSFVTMFSKACDFECKKYGIRVLVSLPGQVATPFSQKAAKKEVPSDKTISPLMMAKRLIDQIEKEKRVDYYDLRYSFLRILTKHLPDALISKVIKASLKKRL